MRGRVVFVLCTIIILCSTNLVGKSKSESLIEFIANQNCETDSCLAKSHYNYAKSWLGRSNDSLIMYGDIAAKFSISKSEQDIQFSSVLLQAVGYSRKRQFEESNELYDSLKNMSPLVSARMSNFLFGSLGSYYYRSEQYDSAEVYFHKSIASFSKDDPDYYYSVGNIYCNLGQLANRRRRYKKSLDYYDLGTNLLDSLDSEKSNKLKNVINQNIGLIYKRLRDFDSAENYFKRGHELINSYPELYRGSVNNLANVYSKTQNWAAFDSCISILKKQNMDEHSEEYCRRVNQLLFIKYSHQNQLDSCEYILQKLEKCNELYKSKESELSLAIFKAGFREKQGRFLEAKKLYEKAIELNIAIGEKRPESNADIYYGYLTSQNHINKDDQSNLYIQSFSGWKDSILKYTIEEETQKWRIEYETERKEQEIKLLQKDQDIIEAQLNRQRSLLYGGGLGVIGCAFGLFYLIQTRRKEKELYLKDIALLKIENKEWYEKVQKYKTTKQKIAIRKEDVIRVAGHGSDIPLVDLCYVQSHGNYLNIYINGVEQPVLLRCSLSKFLEEYLPPNVFVRINKRSIINLNYITRKSTLEIFMMVNDQEKQFNIGRPYKDDFQRLYDDLPDV